MSAVVAMFLSAAVGLVGIAFVYWRGTKDGFKEGFARGCRRGYMNGIRKQVGINDFLEMLRQADEEASSAHSSVLPDMRQHREEVN